MMSPIAKMAELTAIEKAMIADQEFRRMYGSMKPRGGANQLSKKEKAKKKTKRKMAKASRRRNK